MKKTLIALSVAAGMIAAAQAENTTNLYGSLGYSIKVVDDDHVSFSTNDTTWDLNTSTAKFGIKGTEDLSNGLQAFFKFEFGVDNDAGVNETRYAYLGLRGDFGTLTLGKQKTLYATATDYNDIFNDVGFKGKTDIASRHSKIINYMTPDMSGFMAGASIKLDGANAVSDGIDAWEIGALYEANGISAGLAYMNIEQAVGEQEHIGGQIGYSADQYQVGFGAQHESSVGTYYNLAGEYRTGPNTFRAGVDLIDLDGQDNDYNFALGYQYNFSERTYSWIEAEYYKEGEDGVDDGFTAVVGIRHDF